jgi:3',5'-cyclic AMP phosphodiesterase CpdA
MRRLWFLALLAALAAPAQSVEFLHITDTHVMSIQGIHPALSLMRQVNVLTAPQLEATLKDLAGKPPGFLLHTGDMLEAFRYDDDAGGLLNGQIERFQSILKLSPAPMYLALGNRDVSWYRAVDGKQVVVRDQATTSEARAAWRTAFDCFRNGTWYSFEKRAGSTGYLFVVLDNGETSDRELVTRQLSWLRRTLAESKHSALVLAVHIPLGENEFGLAVREIVSGFDRPVLVLAGHRHTDAVEEIAASPRKVQVRTASYAGGKRSMRRVALNPGSIDVYTTSEPANLLLSIPVSQR